jgi:hypothetical protein
MTNNSREGSAFLMAFMVELTLPQIFTSLSVQKPPSLPDFEPKVAYRQ